MRLSFKLLTVLAALLVAGCGVRGGLVPPSAADAPVDEDGNPVPVPPEEDPSFILDGLLL
ncbi:MAG: hypothetical protein AAF590_06360 [Pseudomonadota bacterium]